MVINRNTSKTDKTPQEIQNLGFDEDFNVQAFELLVYDPVSDVLRRVTSDALNHYGTNDVDKQSDILFYEGLEDNDGNWQIVKTSVSGDITSNRFATVKNNNTYTDYATAWTNRATLTYETYGEAF